ncbi:uncharacterized protein QYS62_006401 [Fusarium acuminatum]|jgi:hypothetical protein|uniref:SnoaL-like domain-containing protein n=1 Tax=Fusarium acuminatum TaxID=5515 RepID=A0ABZ2WX61_9HYPO
MTSTSHLNSEQAQVLAVVNDFHEYFSSPPPFTQGSRFTIPQGLITVPFPPEMGGLKTENFRDMYERVSGLLAKTQEAGPTGFKHQLAKPEAEVWVTGDIAAVLVGWSASMDGRGEFVHTVHLVTLHRLPEEKSSVGNPWRIVGSVDMNHLPPDIIAPPVETGPLSEVIAPFEALLTHIKAQDWEAITPLLLPGAGATVWQDSKTPETFLWPEYIKHLQAQAKIGLAVEKKLLNSEARRCADLGFMWAPFVIEVDSQEQAKGVSVCTFRLEDGKWLISGLQEATLRK